MPAMVTAALLFIGALIAGFIVYAPSLNGDFVFDDRALPMFNADAATLTLRRWAGARPLLMATYWVNFHTSGMTPVDYHVFNVIFHAGCTVLIFFAVARILQWSGLGERIRFWAARFSAAFFLLHPAQTESVSYIASRSETLSVFFFLAAFNVFLYRRETAIGLRTSATILVLYASAMTCKEHTAVLPAALLLTDYFFNPGFSFSGIRRNWKLYVPVGVLGTGALLYFATHITSRSNLGFSLKDLTWYEYLFTQFRAIFIYLRLFLLPYGQSVDYNFPISHTLMEHGALFYGLILLALAGCAVYFRKRFPLACYGFLLTLLLLAPTSSFMPIRDTLVERRLYLPFIGLLLIACDGALRIPIPRKTLAWSVGCLCLLFAILAFQRNSVWVNMDSLWRDAYSKNPENPRALMGLADAYAMGGRCAEAIPYFEKAAKIQPGDYKAVFNLASAYDCAGNLPASRAGYESAIRIRPTAEGWDHLAMIQMKSGQADAAMESLANAQRLDRDYLLTYTYRGILLLAQSRFYEAAAQFRNVLASIPADELALRGMDRAQKHVRQF